MGRLYPPVIESTLPACYEENGMVKITIPFSTNRSVSATQVGGFELKIKTIQTGTQIYNIFTANPVNFKINENESYVTFYLKNTGKMKVGQFYKVQIAYIEKDGLLTTEYYNFLNGKITLDEFENFVKDKGVSGYYSAAGVMKFTTKPKVYINNFKENHLNDYTYNYTGYYSQEGGDTAERVYSYSFNIYDQSQNLILSSGECIHNSTLDTNLEISEDNYSVMLDLQYYVTYYIQYTVTTINKLTISSPKYRMIQRETIDAELYADIEAKLNFDNGYIDINLIPHKDDYIERAIELMNSMEDTKWLQSVEKIQQQGFSAEQSIVIFKNKLNLNAVAGQIYLFSSGSFILSRASEDSAFSNWEELTRFKLYESKAEGLIFRDYTIEQGKKYRYSIQQYNDNNLFSKRILSDIIVADFEDAFLYDGNRQLKIKYNPKMTKFTNTVLEQKQDTIGGKYPFIFRNGVVNYHEFPLGGLISYYMDEQQLFLTEEEFHIEEKTINYTTDNIAQERLFKMEVLEWLNNGKPKLFRSPSEGNFLVRLMKVSLRPENKLGRLLHNFSCNAYEIAECSNKNLRKFMMLPSNEEKVLTILQSKTIDLSNCTPGQILNQNANNLININSLQIEGMPFGETVLITYQDGTQETIQIGVTGNYYLNNLNSISSISIQPKYKNIGKISKENFNDPNQVYYILNEEEKYVIANHYDSKQKYFILVNASLKGLITYSFNNIKKNSYSMIDTITYEDPQHKQFIGEHDILKELTHIGEMRDAKKELTAWHYLKVEKRPVDKVITQFLDDSLQDNGEYYYGVDGYNTERMPLIELQYPIGMRTYQSGEYYIKNSDGSYVREKYDSVYSEKQTYYLKGQYEIVPKNSPVGLVNFENSELFIVDKTQTDLTYILATKYNPNETYYSVSYDIYDKPIYTEVKYVCKNENYIYEPEKFYRVARTDYVNEKGVLETLYSYAASPSFNPDMEYYILNTSRNGYVNAYVTIDSKYKYNTIDYYVHLFNPDTNEDTYERIMETDYNTNKIKLLEGYQLEYQDNGVLKYYKMKPVLPHILHLVGTTWELNYGKESNDKPYVDEQRYNFIPKKYKDFYNKKDYTLDEYAPYIEINGEKIYVKDSLIFDIEQLKNINISSFSSGNGVIVDVGYQMKTINFIMEESLSEKNSYETAKNILENVLSLVDKNSINLLHTNTSYYNSYLTNSYHKSVYTAYQSLARAVSTQIM